MYKTVDLLLDILTTHLKNVILLPKILNIVILHADILTPKGIYHTSTCRETLQSTTVCSLFTGTNISPYICHQKQWSTNLPEVYITYINLVIFGPFIQTGSTDADCVKHFRKTKMSDLCTCFKDNEKESLIDNVRWVVHSY